MRSRLHRLSARLRANEAPLLAAILAAAIVSRILLVVDSPTPFGYVWDFYVDGVRILFSQGRLPIAEDCWQCAHPPVFYVAAWPFYALGRALSHANDDLALRFTGGLAMAAGCATAYYGYRLLRLFRCRGGSLVAGVSLLVSFPCLFISSYGPEADILLAAILSAFVFYLTRYVAKPSAGFGAFEPLRLGVLAGLAIGTKYSGLAGIVSALVVFALLAVRTPHPQRLLRDAVLVAVLCGIVGGWKYYDNYRRYGELLHANGSAAQGFALGRGRAAGAAYEFTTLRLGELMELFARHPPAGSLTMFPVYKSVPTTLQALAWSDMSFFSVKSRHGDASQPHPRKLIPVGLTMSVIVLGFVPELLAAIGFVVGLRHRTLWPVAIVTVVSAAAYVWWFLPQTTWALKTKYLLFLWPGVVLYTTIGLGWLVRRAPAVAVVASLLIVALAGAATVYNLVFAVGGV